MSDTAINQVLAQMRALEAAAANRPEPQSTGGAAGSDFATVLQDSLAAVNEQHTHASQLANAFTQGEPGVDLSRVMINLEKASLSFEAVSQTRNRLLSAYREVMNMSV